MSRSRLFGVMPVPEEESDHDDVRPMREAPGPDAHGQAAMLLIESVLHGLIKRSVVTVADAVGFVEAAVDVGQEMQHDLSDAPSSIDGSLAHLRSIATSLRIDLDGRHLKTVD